jgi:hypothetical protein
MFQYAEPEPLREYNDLKPYVHLFFELFGKTPDISEKPCQSCRGVTPVFDDAEK